jgi:hypothetical protein
MKDDDLSSWKEIAEFLGVTPRTAQHWEKQRGMPVRRLPGGLKASVRASAEELRVWKSGAAVKPEEDLAPGARPLGRWILIGLAVCALAAGGWALALRGGSSRAIAKAEMQGNTLVALDERGRTLWTHAFEHTPVALALGSSWQHYLQTIRWKKGAAPELAAAALLDVPGGTAQRVICFDAKGRQRWAWEPAVDLLDFNGERFEQRWSVGQLLADEDGAEPVVWAAVSNPLRWASALYKLDSKGNARLHYANAGSIMRILKLPGKGHGRLIVAGVNNAWAQTFLAEIDPDGEPAFSPPSGADRYHFTNGPKGLPLRYFLFPQSELSRVNQVPYFHVSALMLTQQHILVEVFTGAATVFLYEFDNQLTPIRVRTTSSGIGLHQSYEKRGLLDHSVKNCPEMTGTHTVREWTPKGGWRDDVVPVSSPYNTR